MYKCIFILGFCIILIRCQLNLISIEPKFELHDRRNNLIVTCNSTGVTKNATMIFFYDDRNYTIPRINNISGIYVGNFSVVSPDQNKVSIICFDPYTKKLIGTKLYLLGYPPGYISQSFQVALNCRDFNMQKVICCLTPNVTTIERILGFEESRKAAFNVTLLLSDSDVQIPNENSCFDLTHYNLGPTLPLTVIIENALGSERYNFKFDRYNIQKPNEPKIAIFSVESKSFSFYVDMQEVGEYLAHTICNSTYPIRQFRALSFNISLRRSDTFVLDNWAPYSDISCTTNAQVSFGGKPIGSVSDTAFSKIKLLESKPNTGPYLTPSFVNYLTTTKRRVILDIIIYFGNVGLLDQNGVISGYRWRCSHCSHKRRNVTNTVQFLPNNVRSISLNEAMVGSTIAVTACTKVGCSDSWTSVTLQELQEDDRERRLTVKRSSANLSNLTITWLNEHNGSFLAACSYRRGSDCSSIEMIQLLGNSSGTVHFQIDDSMEWKFALIPNGKFQMYKMKWKTCFYNYLRISEVKSELKEFEYSRFLKNFMSCSVSQCDLHLNITIPTCHQFRSLFFSGLEVNYTSDGGDKVIRETIYARNEMRFTLSNLSPGLKSYSVKISVITSSNVTIPWFDKIYVTNFWNVTYVGVFVLIFLILIGALVGLAWKGINYLRRSYVNKNYIQHPKSNITRNYNKTTNPSEPVKLLNTNDNLSFQVSPYSTDLVDGYSNYSQAQESTFSTSIESSSKDHSSSEVNISCGDSMQYTKRPEIDNNYSHIVIPKMEKELAMEFPNEEIPENLVC